MVGLLDGYANQSQEGFLREAQTFNNPGAQVQAPPQQEAQPEQPQEQVATSITWSDAGGSPKEQPTGPLGQQTVDPEASSGVPSDNQVAATTSKAVKAQLEGKTDAQTVQSASQWMGDSTGLADAITKLDAGIEKQESRRDSMKLMMFGLSMLSGAGINSSIQAANAVGGFNKQRIDQLYSQRKEIQDRVTAKALNDAGLYTSSVQDAQLKAQAKTQIDNSDASWDTSDMTEAQGKSFSLGNEAITGNAELTAIENAGDFDPRDIAESFQTALLRNENGEITGLRADVLNKMNPKKAAYLRSTMKLITAKLRKESGAAISASEWSSEFEKIVPANEKEFKYAQDYRQRIINGLISTSGAPNKSEFYKAHGFSEDHNADEWFKDLFGNVEDKPAGKTASGEAVDLDSLLGG